ncbi:MAG: glucoamylase family protein, partial [Bacteroidota bacterium]
YHFLKKKNGLREWNCELSSIDTGLLMCGVLFAQSYYDKNTPAEKEIRSLADSLYRRVDWKWMTDGRKGIPMAWKPEEGFHKWIWFGYTEAMLLYTLALGSPTHPVGEEAWGAFNEKYLWANHYGQDYLSFMALFGHQYSHVWIDFRGIQDGYMKNKGIDYFENSRRATYIHRTYATLNPNKWNDYSDTIWGMTACDGPKDTIFTVNGIKRDFRSYSARGTGAEEHLDDGTIAPTAAGGSVAFAPEIVIPALKAIRNKYGSNVWTKYGFVDSFNPTYITPSTPNGWFDTDYLGIDQGPIVLMIENYRNDFIWEVMKKNPYIVNGLKRAGFTGGWLQQQSHGKQQKR